MKGAAEANVDTAKDAASLPMHQEMNGNNSGMHPAVGLVEKETVSAKMGFVEWKIQG